MDLRIVTLDHPQSLAKRKPPKAKHWLDLYSFFLGALTTSIVLGLLGGLAIRVLVHDDPAQAASANDQHVRYPCDCTGCPTCTDRDRPNRASDMGRPVIR